MSTKENMTSELEDPILPSIEPTNVIDVFDADSGKLIQTTIEDLKKSFYKPRAKPGSPVNIVYKVVYPDDFNLRPLSTSRKIKKSGRPKKSNESPQTPAELVVPRVVPSQKSKIHVVAKTRSGREVKFPKHIQSDFTRDFNNIEIDDNHSSTDLNNCDIIKTSDFVKYIEKNKKKEKIEEKPLEQDSLQKKRRISAQYRCPKCKKAYLGRVRILEHLRKNPSHGPMHQTEKNNFEVWNYLVSITQKCPASERGPKFCQELSNLLHNLLLLTNALFKRLGSASNEVKVDRILGNAIGLAPDTYYFDDNNLYKDVTILQLMGNTDFLNSIRSKSDDNIKAPEKFFHCSVEESMLQSMLISSEANDAIAKQIDGIKINLQQKLNSDEEINFLMPPEASNNLSNNCHEIKSDMNIKDRESQIDYKSCDEKDRDVNFKPKNDCFLSNLSHSTNQSHLDNNKRRPTTSPKIKILSNILLQPPKLTLSKQSSDNKTSIIIKPELMTDNSVLMPMQNHGVDELMLPAHILDNSSSSDELMNVDQFVNERFTRIIESDLEVANNSNSMNLDLPPLDIFEFNSS